MISERSTQAHGAAGSAGSKPRPEPSAELFADLAAELAAQLTVEDTARRVTELAHEMLSCDLASVLLVLRGGRIESTAVTGEPLAKADRLQLDLGEGPGLTAIRHDQIAVAQFGAAAAASSAARAELCQWPAWQQSAAELGIDRLISIPLVGIPVSNAIDPGATDDYHRGVPHVFGALELCSGWVDGPADFQAERTFARHAAVALVTAHRHTTLTQAVEARTITGRAQGILMERFEVDAEQAFAVLRRYSQDNNLKLRHVAEHVVSTRQLPPESSHRAGQGAVGVRR